MNGNAITVTAVLNTKSIQRLIEADAEWDEAERRLNNPEPGDALEALRKREAQAMRRMRDAWMDIGRQVSLCLPMSLEEDQAA